MVIINDIFWVFSVVVVEFIILVLCIIIVIIGGDVIVNIVGVLFVFSVVG